MLRVGTELALRGVRMNLPAPYLTHAATTPALRALANRLAVRFEELLPDCKLVLRVVLVSWAKPHPTHDTLYLGYAEAPP